MFHQAQNISNDMCMPVITLYKNDYIPSYHILPSCAMLCVSYFPKQKMSDSCVSETIVDRRNKKVETEREGDNYEKKDHPQGALLLRLRAASSIMCFKT